MSPRGMHAQAAISVCFPPSPFAPDGIPPLRLNARNICRGRVKRPDSRVTVPASASAIRILAVLPSAIPKLGELNPQANHPRRTPARQMAALSMGCRPRRAQTVPVGGGCRIVPTLRCRRASVAGYCSSADGEIVGHGMHDRAESNIGCRER